MFGKKNKGNESDNICDLAVILKMIKEAEAVLVGVGDGVYEELGITSSRDLFEMDYMKDAHKQGSKFGLKTEELQKFWAKYSKFVYENRYKIKEAQIYKELYELIKEKKYFITTLNPGRMLGESGFDEEKVFYAQGDYALLQCTIPCSEHTYNNEEIIMQMIGEIKDGKVPVDLIPYCPRCGRELICNLRENARFVRTEEFKKGLKGGEEFIEKYKRKKMLIIELGAEFDAIGLLRYPFWNLVKNNKKIKYICINKHDASCGDDIKDRTIGVEKSPSEMIHRLYLHKKKKRI